MADEKRFITRIGGYAIDCVITETHERESDVTAFAVEEGSDVNDNVKRKSKTLSMEGIVSDTPVGEIAIERDATQGPGVMASDVAMIVLEDFWESGEPIVVETKRKTYQSMVLSKFTITVDKDTGRALKFSGSFTEMRIRKNERTIVLVRPDVRVQKKAKLGNQPINYAGGVAFEKKTAEAALPDDRFNEDGRLTNDKLTKSPDSVSHVKNPITKTQTGSEDLPFWANAIPGANAFADAADKL